MENFETYKLDQTGQQTQAILDQVATNTADIAQLRALYEALTQNEPVIIQPSDTWPVADPQENVIYRVIDRVNTPPQSYSDYMWNGTAMVLMATYNNSIDNEPTPGSNNLVKSGGVAASIVFDISAYHATGSTLATYSNLAAALGTDGANVPASVRKGGMSIKFVQSSDNNYVRYNLIANEFTTDITAWIKDDESKKSSGIYIDRGTTYSEKYGNTNRTCVFYPIPDKNAIYHIRVSEINNQTESGMSIGVMSTQSPYTAAHLFVFDNIEKLDNNDVVLMFKIPENRKDSAAYIGVFQNTNDSSLCSFKVELSYCSKDSVCDHSFRMWNKITSLDLNIKAGYVRANDGFVRSYNYFVYTDLFLLKKGETIVVGNAHSNIGCIYTHNQQTISPEDNVTVLASSGASDDYQELSYTAQVDIMIGVSFYICNKFKVFSSRDTEILLENSFCEEGQNW